MEKQESSLNGDNTEGANLERRTAKIKAAAIALHLSGGPAPSKEVLEIIGNYIDKKVTMHEVLTELYPAFLSQPQPSRSYRIVYGGENAQREDDVSKAA
ncbi:MAG: hypothetical protein EOO61_02055 [Hymenobacter sp.]|nr:MAG: hypothetical protein EOO61_02055 [Hymenobacter sp.]